MTLYVKSLKFDSVSLSGILLSLIPLYPYGVAEIYGVPTLLRRSVSTSKITVYLSITKLKELLGPGKIIFCVVFS